MKKLKILVYMHLNLASTLYPSSSQISERSFLSTEFEDILYEFSIPSLRTISRFAAAKMCTVLEKDRRRPRLRLTASALTTFLETRGHL